MRSRHAVTTARVSLFALGLCLLGQPASAQPGAPHRKPVPAEQAVGAPPSPPGVGAPPPQLTPQGQPKPLAQSLSGLALAEYEGGKLLFVNKDYANALIKFQHAYDLSRDPRLLWNVAVCHKELRRYTRMLATLRRLLDEGGPLLTAQDREAAAAAAKAVESFVSPLKLTVNEPGADVFVDGEKVGTTPFKELPLVDVGSHEVRVSKRGFKDAVKSVLVAGAGDVAVAVELERDLHRGRIVVVAGRDDLIQLDGKAVGRARWEGTVASGGHTLRVTAPDMQPYQSEVLVKDNEVRHIQVTLTRLPSSELKQWMWIVGGSVLLTGAVVGGAFLLQPTQQYVSGTIPPGTIPIGGE